MNQKLSGLGNETLVGKINSLKTWETELKKREKLVEGKEDKVRNLIGRIEMECESLPEKEGFDGEGDNVAIKQMNSTQVSAPSDPRYYFLYQGKLEVHS